MNPATAHALVGKAIRRGELVRQPCEACGSTEVDAHHDDYSKPLDVRWLCRTHHKHHHRDHPTERHEDAPIMARIALSESEWRAVRVLAIRQDTTTQQLLADIVRARLAEQDAA